MLSTPSNIDATPTTTWICYSLTLCEVYEHCNLSNLTEKQHVDTFKIESNLTFSIPWEGATPAMTKSMKLIHKNPPTCAAHNPSRSAAVGSGSLVHEKQSKRSSSITGAPVILSNHSHNVHEHGRLSNNSWSQNEKKYKKCMNYNSRRRVRAPSSKYFSQTALKTLSGYFLNWQDYLIISHPRYFDQYGENYCVSIMSYIA